MHTRTLVGNEIAGDSWWTALLRRFMVEAPARPRPVAEVERGDDEVPCEQALTAPLYLDGQMW